MKPAAIGRILIWRGGSLWIGRGGEPAQFHAHHAIQISLPFPKGRIKFRLPGEAWKTYSAAIVAPQQRHAFDARDELVAQIFVEPESRDGRVLQDRIREEGIVPLAEGTLDSQILALAAAYEDRAEDSRLIALAHAAISALSRSAPAPQTTLDRRIHFAVERIRQCLGKTVALADIASAVHLSPERFRHLFVEQTGVRFRAYVLWVRLESALGAYVAGKSLTEAAHAGGFSDSAHLSRTFRKMFGISAASILLE
jgi:AraC-like DNA-binding protein